MMSEYYDKDSLINVLKYHLLPEDGKNVNLDKVINDGLVYSNYIKEVKGCYICGIKTFHGNITIFVHPTICIEVYYDFWTNKDVYIGRAEEEIW